MIVNILVLGNGFDLAHELNTTYKNFLEAVKITDILVNMDKSRRVIRWKETDKTHIPKLLCERLDKVVESINNKDDKFTQFYSFRESNFWFKFFDKKAESTWIDFEKGIKEVCGKLEDKIYNGGDVKSLDSEINIDIDFTDYKDYFSDRFEIKTYSKLLEKLEDDLNQLINSLDYYISTFCDEQDVNIISPDIIPLGIDKVISFNYSMTYQNLYSVSPNIDCDYIHGKAGEPLKGDNGNKYMVSEIKNKKFSNLVLGYDEEKVNDIMLPIFAPFKKYYQRVLKGTGNKYVGWVDEIQKDKEKEHYVYFFGHSMDVTDKDVIRALILNSNVTSTVYYYSGSDKIGKLKNLIAVLGYDKFVEYTRNGKIKLIEQNQLSKKEDERVYISKMVIKSLYDFPYITEKSYELFEKWFTNLVSNPGLYQSVYYYLPVDALQKYNVEDEKVEKLKEICNKYWRWTCNPDEFLEEYKLYYGSDSVFENLELKKMLIENYEKRVESEKLGFDGFLQKINLNGNTFNSIIGGDNIGVDKLKKVTECFLKAFDKGISYPEIYEGMLNFCKFVEPNAVKNYFSSIISDSNLSMVKRNRIKIVIDMYNAAPPLTSIPEVAKA